MPSGRFEVDTYRVQISRGGSISRVLYALGTEASGTEGHRDYALLYFRDSTSAYVGSLRVPQFPTHQSFALSVYLPIDDFDATYRILQTEKPLYIHFSYEHEPINPGSVTHRMTYFYLSSENEPLGEGPEDAGSAAP